MFEWHRACPLAGRTMLRTTAILIVMLLAGTPGVSLACGLWCNTPAAERHHSAVGCHRTTDAGISGEQVIAAAAGCHDALTVTAFVNEARQSETRSEAMVSAVLTPAVFVRHDFTREGWLVCNGQSARPPAFRTILRI